MKLDLRQAASFLRNPGTARVVLLHGDDEGQIRDRVRDITRCVTGSLSDPFLIAELGRESWSQIPSEMAALSMIGGRRVVIARDATDAILPHVTAALAGAGEALLIVEAPGLGKGRLRTYAEASPAAATLASYAEDGAALTATISSMLATHGLRAEPDILARLCQALAGDRAVIRGEIEKLALLAPPDRPLDAATVEACIPDAGEGSGDSAIVSMMAGDLVRGDAALEAAFADGLNGITVLRLALMHLQKLHMARLSVDEGSTASDAVRAMRPPVFHKQIGMFTKTLALWPADRLAKAIEEARKVEIACKQTGGLPDILTRRFLYSLARVAQRRG